MEDMILKENEDGSVVTLKEVQETIYSILVEFDRLCRKHDLDYTLAYGSELGAVRHNGFIPWDDDIDVFMLRDDYMKLVKVLEDELKYPFYHQCFESNNKYNTLTPPMKIKIENTEIREKTLLRNRLKKNGLFIDVFILESASKDLWRHRGAQAVSTVLMLPIILFDLLHIDSRPFTSLLYHHNKRYSLKHKDSEYAGIGVNWVFNGFTDTRVLKKDVFPSREHIFEDQMFRVSNNSDAVLKVFYGENYMIPPKESQQKPHHISEIVINKKEKIK